MAWSLYFYSPRSAPELDEGVEVLRKAFQQELEDLFSDDELERFAPALEDLAPASVAERLAELCWEDFENHQEKPALRESFEGTRSTLSLEALPFLETNPFQVSFLRSLLTSIGEGVLDRGGAGELLTLDEFLGEIAGLKGMESLLREAPPASLVRARGAMDELLDEVYQELERLRGRVDPALWPEKQQLIVRPLLEKRLDAQQAFKAAGLNAKDFGDHLESLKFRLRRL